MYGPVCPVVWKGGLSPPPPIGYRLLSFEMTQLFITEHSGHRDALRVDHTAVHTTGVHREAVATSLLECFRPNRFRMADMELDGFAVVTRSIVEAKTKANGPRFAVSSRSNGRLSCDLKNLLL